MMKKIFLSLLISFPLFCVAQRHIESKDEYLKELVRTASTDKTTRQISVNRNIPDQQTAVTIAENILFKIYGKKQIIGEKLYNVDFVDGYWILRGTLPEGYVGGVFLIIFSAKDGKVIRITHGK